MPGVEEDDRGKEVEQPGRDHGDDEGAEYRIGEEVGEGEARFGDLCLDGFDCYEDGGEDEVSARARQYIIPSSGCAMFIKEINSRHKYSPEIHLRHIKLIAPLRSVPQRKDETSNQCRQIQPLEHDSQNQASGSQQVLVRERRSQDLEDQEEVANCEPCEEHIEGLIAELDDEEGLAHEGMVGAPDLVEVREGVDGGEEGAVEPSVVEHSVSTIPLFIIAFSGPLAPALTFFAAR